MLLSRIDTPDAFFNAIPREVHENIVWRMDMHRQLAGDTSAQKVFKELCLAKPHIFFNSVAWTINPQKKAGERNQPFILRPKQEEAISMLVRCINDGRDAGIEKTRKEGATELVAKLFALYVLLTPLSNFIVGSRKEDLVDKTGDQYTIFAKIDHVINCLPAWWRVNVERNHCHMRIMETNSSIEGEATNENFSAGSRATAVLLDEFGRVDRNVAESIEGSVHDVAECIIYSSTHWLGSNHPFNKALRKPTTTVVTLPWYENPEKNQGLYKSPDINVIEIVDIDYYRNLCPEVFNDINAGESFKYSDFEQVLLTLPEEVQDKLSDIRFVADGCEGIPGDVRSPWHDAAEEQRRGNKRDFISNVWMSPLGASDMVFDDVTLNRIKGQCIRRPDYEGEIAFEYDQNGRVIRPIFRVNAGRRRLLWWGTLVNGRPSQTHNYVIGCDPSLGTGNSNSVAAIYDVNGMELVGTWVCPNSPPEVFADTVTALGKWCGGKSGKAFLIWENNGGHGINFGRRILWNDYTFVYTQKTEANRRRRKGPRYGWHSGREQKADILGELGIALAEGMRREKHYRAMLIHDEDLLDELFDYMYLESGEIEASKRADLTSGAREKHGDRVIAAALCVLGSKDQTKAVIREQRAHVPYGSMAWRMKQHKIEDEKKKGDSPFIV